MSVSLRRFAITIAMLICAAALTASPRPASAAIGTLDVVPAATLLFPYFEVDLNNVNGVTTLMTVHNASATAILGHVVVYTDQGVPVTNFNIYMTGFDLQAFNMRDILNGFLPQTASAGAGPDRHHLAKRDLFARHQLRQLHR